MIDDPATIARQVAFLGEHDSGRRAPWGRFPAPQVSAVLEHEMVVWAGSDWLGGRPGDGAARDNRLRALSAADRSEVLGILGLRAH